VIYLNKTEIIQEENYMSTIKTGLNSKQIAGNLDLEKKRKTQWIK